MEVYAIYLKFGPVTGASVGPVPTPLKASQEGYLVDT